MKLLNNLQFNYKSQAPSHHNTPLHDNRSRYFPLARGMKLMMPSENSVFPSLAPMIRGGIIKTPNMEAESSSKPVPHSVVLQIGCKLVMMVTGPVLHHVYYRYLQLPPAQLSPH